MESVGEYSNVGNCSSYDEYDGRLDSECWSLIKKIILPLLTIHKNTKNRYQLTDVEDLVKCFNHLSHLGFSRSEILSLITFKDRAFAQRMSDSGYKLNSQTGLFSRDSKKGSEDALEKTLDSLEKSFKESFKEKVFGRNGRIGPTSDKSLLDVSSTVASSEKKTSSTSSTLSTPITTPRFIIDNTNEAISINSNRRFSDLEKHLLELTNILLQQKISSIEQQDVVIKEIREGNPKVEISILSSKLDDVLTLIGPPRSISSDYVDYSDWLQIKWSEPYDEGNKPFTRSFAVHPKLLDLFKIAYRGRKTQLTALNQAMLDYCMKVPDASRIVQRFLSSPDELHSVVKLDSDIDE